MAPVQGDTQAAQPHGGAAAHPCGDSGGGSDPGTAADAREEQLRPPFAGDQIDDHRRPD